MRGFLKSGLRPDEVADSLLEAVRNDLFYVMPVQPEIEQALALRQEDIRLRRNPTIASAGSQR